MVLSNVGAADSHILDHWQRHRRHLKRAWWICGTLAVTDIVVSVIAFGWFDVAWWLFFVPALILVLLALPLGRSFQLPHRARPDTPREIAVIVGMEVTTWGNATHDRHMCRIIARPIGSATDALIHTYGFYPTEVACPVRPGMVIGFRRHPTMRHHVWLDDALTPAEAARMRLGGQFSSAAVETGEVARVEILDDTPVGDWWLTRITVCAENGTFPCETIHRLPEELAELEPGTTVHFVRHHGDCVVLPAVARLSSEPSRFEVMAGTADAQ